MMTLGGCSSSGTASRPAACDWLVPYAPAFQARAATELDALPDHSAVRVLIEDYGELRARIRAACQR